MNEFLGDLIDQRCPRVGTSNWEALTRNGWRWEFNLDRIEADTPNMIKEFQNRHGKENVTIGYPFHETEMIPVYDPAIIGLYVRDVEAIIAKHIRDLNDDRALAEWIGS